MLYEVICADKACKYLHNPQLIREERDRLRKLWDQPRPFREIGSQVNLPPGRPPERLKPSLNAIEQEDPGDLQPDVDDPEFCLIGEIMRIQEVHKHWRAAHKEATVTSEGKTIATEVMTLFDTGASMGNFLSQAFVDRSKVEIRHKMNLEVTFKALDGDKTANLEFWVMPDT